MLAEILGSRDAPDPARIAFPGGLELSGTKRRIPVAFQAVHTERGRAFGRGSPVCDYWLERCQGFEAVGSDGRRLGRVRRFETPHGDAFLRLGRLRSRVVPVSAVEVVWPAASLLLIADPDTAKEDVGTPDPSISDPGPREAPQGASSLDRVGGWVTDAHLPTSTSRPRWEDETLPWWELVQDDDARDEASKPPGGSSLLGRRWTVIRPYVSGGRGAVRELSRWMIEHAQTLVALLLRRARDGWHVTCVALRFVGKRCVAARAFAANLVRRERLVLGRLLFRLAVWVAGDGGQLGGASAFTQPSDTTK